MVDNVCPQPPLTFASGSRVLGQMTKRCRQTTDRMNPRLSHSLPTSNSQRRRDRRQPERPRLECRAAGPSRRFCYGVISLIRPPASVRESNKGNLGLNMKLGDEAGTGQPDGNRSRLVFVTTELSPSMAETPHLCFRSVTHVWVPAYSST